MEIKQPRAIHIFSKILDIESVSLKGVSMLGSCVRQVPARFWNPSQPQVAASRRGMTGSVKGQVLGDARHLYPFLERNLCHAVLEARKHQTFPASAYHCRASSPMGLWIICLVFCIRVVM